RANPNIKVIISSYDFPNFNVTGSFLGIDYCEQYACPKREDLSRDDNGNGQIDESELITDAEINAMMDLVEGIRKTLADSHPNILYDNGMGLMHYYYGYDDPLYPYIPPGSTPYPQGQSPYATGGDLDTPTDRDNFRGVSLCGFIGNFPADPIHLDAEGYTYKIKNQFDNIFFENFRGEPDETFWSVGAEDGYVDIIEETANGNGIRVGDDDSGWPSLDNEYRGILSFNTEPLPDNADILGASLYIIRSGENDNPFFHSDRSPVLDIKEGYFGDNSALEWTDGTAPADATDIGCFHGLANENKWAIRVDLEAVALDYINLTGTTQLRMYFDYADWSPEYINFYDGDGIPALLPPEVEARQNSTLYTHRIVKKKSSPQGIAIEESLETGSAIEKRDGYVYYEKLKDIDIDEHGDTLLYFTTMVAIEHPGLAKHMSDTYNAPGNGYAPFLDITYQVPLPVDLLAFEAEKVEEEMTLLYWETGAEVDLEGFYIEHSVDAKQWKTLAFLVAKATNASQGDTYSFLHKAPSNGENYYRLKMKDLDGTVEYSDIRSLRFEGNAGLQNVGPNPFDDYFKLEWAARGAATLQIQLVDMLGRVLVERSIIVREDEGSYCLTGLSGLPMGTYMLKVWNGKAWYMERLVKK
ncbi:MAG TPA: T9SS type A sorting domain-containing protein, partial [Phaeodactylibacter sp.]|nr:T9SS type A sorting domain-containing protein [Phaeodactylibacter sp.]